MMYERVEIRAEAVRTGPEPYTGQVLKRGQEVILHEGERADIAHAIASVIEQQTAGHLENMRVVGLRRGQWERVPG
jgi:predicted DNA-binding antitoxin AbrB/MazE fold protein